VPAPSSELLPPNGHLLLIRLSALGDVLFAKRWRSPTRPRRRQREREGASR